MLLMLSLSLPAGRSQPFSFFLQLIFPIGEEKCIAWALHNFSGVLRIRKRHSKVNLYFIIRKKKKKEKDELENVHPPTIPREALTQ